MHDFRQSRRSYGAGGWLTGLTKIQTPEQCPHIRDLPPEKRSGQPGTRTRNHIDPSRGVQCSIGKQHDVNLTTFKNILIGHFASDEDLDFKFEIIRNIEKRVTVSSHHGGLKRCIGGHGAPTGASDRTEKHQTQ